MIDGALTATVLAAFLWGLRHGVDWDHIAAITDITSTQTTARSGVLLGTLYALGHSTVVGALCVIAILFGRNLPDWVDTGMGFLVGLTLVLLALYVAVALVRLRRGGDFRLRSRWWVLLNGASHLYERLRATLTRTPMREPKRYFENYIPKTAFAVGLIHGIGAETPTQVLIFAAAAGFAGQATAFLLLVSFVAGMLVTNTAMIVASSLGYRGTVAGRPLYVGAAMGTAAFSLVVGSFFLLGMDSALPAFFADPAAVSEASR